MSREQLRTLMSRNADSDTSKSFTQSRKPSNQPKITKLITEMFAKRQSSQEILRHSTTSQRAISPQVKKLYQMPDSLQNIYKQIKHKLQKSTPKQRTEECRSHKNDSTASTLYESEEFITQCIAQEECVSAIIAVQARKNKVIKLCQNYLNQIPQFQFEQKDPIAQRIIWKSILLERIAILVILFESLEGEYEDSLPHIRNLLFYVHNTMVINLQLMQCNSHQQRQQVDGRLSRATQKPNTTSGNMVQLKKNNNIVHSLLILFIENSPHLKYNNLERILSRIDSITLQQGTRMLRTHISTILDEIQNLRLSRDMVNESLQMEQQLSIPYLPKTQRYCLVIDLDETLVHYQELAEEGQFLVRPYAEHFLIEMSQHYEIIIFTAALQDYADYILDLIDKEGVISHRLYRQHTVCHDGVYVKDLQRLGRDTKKTIIIDNLAENFQLQSENGISIASWYGEPEDRALYELAPLLIQIVQKQYKDVRVALRQFRDKMIENIEQGIEQPHLHLQLD